MWPMYDDIENKVTPHAYDNPLRQKDADIHHVLTQLMTTIFKIV